MKVMEIRAARVAEGVKIYLKSEQVASWLTAEACGAPVTISAYGLRAVGTPSIGQLSEARRAGLGVAWGDADRPWLVRDGRVNLSFLRFEGVRSGVTFTIPGMFSRESVELWATACKELSAAVTAVSRPFAFRMRLEFDDLTPGSPS